MAADLRRDGDNDAEIADSSAWLPPSFEPLTSRSIATDLRAARVRAATGGELATSSTELVKSIATDLRGARVRAGLGAVAERRRLSSPLLSESSSMASDLRPRRRPRATGSGAGDEVALLASSMESIRSIATDLRDGRARAGCVSTSGLAGTMATDLRPRSWTSAFQPRSRWTLRPMCSVPPSASSRNAFVFPVASSSAAMAASSGSPPSTSSMLTMVVSSAAKFPRSDGASPRFRLRSWRINSAGSTEYSPVSSMSSSSPSTAPGRATPIVPGNPPVSSMDTETT
jgi:hypothetical protein